MFCAAVQVVAEAGRQHCVADAARPQHAAASMMYGSLSLRGSPVRDAKPAAALATPVHVVHGRQQTAQTPPGFSRTAAGPAKHAARRAARRGRLHQRTRGLQMRPLSTQSNRLRAPAAAHADACPAGAAACRPTAAAEARNAAAVPWQCGCMPCNPPGASSSAELLAHLEVLVLGLSCSRRAALLQVTA